jgi:hypothetical protein
MGIFGLRRSERKSLQEIVRLGKLLRTETNEDIKKELQGRINLCHALSWKDYKFYTKES